jgi:chromosomal replication initiator protein
MTDEVQIIPFSGRPLEFDHEGASVRFPSSAHGFLLGQENKILEPLIQEIMNGTIAPERQPVLLYGVPGSGRTHLLKGILETWRKNQSNETLRRQSYYLTCADFARHFADSIATRTTDDFRRRYCRAKLLLLDDLEQLFGKPAAQMELRLLLDAFGTEGGVIVMTAQTLPNDKETNRTVNKKLGGKKTGRKMESFSAELAVRIQGGTTIPVFPPGETARRRFFYDLASALRIPATETQLNAVAKELTGTIPQLYATVVQKYVETKAVNESLDTTFWQQFSRKRNSRKGKANKSNTTQDLTEITKWTATYFSLKLNDLRGQSRSKTVVLARSLAVYLAKTQQQLTFKEIGHFFGKRDPSTVRHLFDKVQRELQTDSELRDHLFRLDKKEPET